MNRHFLEFASKLNINTDGEIQPLGALRPDQSMYDRQRTTRDIVINQRQVGMTTLELARDIWFVLQNKKMVTILTGSHPDDRTIVKDMLRTMLQTPGLDLPQIDERENSFLFCGTNSSAAPTISIRSQEHDELGRMKAKGRSGTINRLHVIEPAFFEKADDDLLYALLECVPSTEFGTEIILESCLPEHFKKVPRGMLFKELYKNALLNHSGWNVHVFGGPVPSLPFMNVP